MSACKVEKNLMTEGTIWKQILAFSIPLVLGNLLQEMYNTVDSIIVGNYVGSSALAAVSAGTSLINLLIAFSQGTAVGAGVVIAQYLGAGDKKKVEASVHTSLAISILLGMILSVLGVVFGEEVLGWMRTPAEVMPAAVSYFRLYSVGLVFNIIYNMAAGILNAAGNAKTSLWYLGIASITNIILDFVLIRGIQMGIEGAALATDISQALSCVLAMIFLVRTKESYQVVLRKIRFQKNMAKRIIRLGLPAGIQNMVVSLSNVIIQSSVNGFGADVMAGFGAYLKIDGFNIMPIRSFAMAGTTFTGQNYGAGKMKRVRQGMYTTVGIGAIYSACTGTLLLLYADKLMNLFTNNQQVIGYGILAAHYFCPFYICLSAMHILAGIVRGTGRTVQPMLILLGSMCALRAVWVKLIVPVFFGTISGIYIVYPISWIVGMSLMGIYTWRAKVVREC